MEICIINVTQLDDRAYTAALGAYGLMLERRKTLMQKRQKKSDKSLADRLPIRQAKRRSLFG